MATLRLPQVKRLMGHTTAIISNSSKLKGAGVKDLRV
jgi:hypothetical protein